MCEEHPVLEAIAKAKQAQQLFDMNNDVQLEIDLNPGEEEANVGDGCSDKH